MEEIKKEKKKQPYISYLKGYSIVAVILIHLIDWGGAGGIKFFQYFKELLFPGVMFFVAMIGSLIYFAYKDSDLKKTTIKLIKRGLQIIGIYYLYSIVKLFIYNFQKEPYFAYFDNGDKIKDLINIITLKVSNVPLPILFTLSVFMILSPLFLFIIKKSKHPKIIILFILVVVIFVNYFINLPSNFLTNILYSNGYVFHPIMLWMIPYLCGILVSMFDFEKKKRILFPIFSVLTIVYGLYYYVSKTASFLPSFHMYPLDLFYVVFSLFFMYFLIYVFGFFEKINNKLSNNFLNVIKFLGENTLSIYVFHWVIIDLTYWLLAPKEWVIWITVPIFVFAFVLLKFKTRSKIVLVK